MTFGYFNFIGDLERVVSDNINYCSTADWINENTFIEFLKNLLKRYIKAVAIVDRATYHVKSKK